MTTASAGRRRRLLTSNGLIVGLVFLGCALALPRLLSRLQIERFEASQPADLYVAMPHGDSFDLVALKAPSALPAAPFVGSRDKPGAPENAESTDRVRVVRSDGAGTLLETVWSNDDHVVTSRYRVTGQQVFGVSRQVFGVPQAFQGLLAAAVIAIALRAALRRWRPRPVLNA